MHSEVFMFLTKMSNKNGQIIDSWSCFSRLKPSLWPTFFGWHCLLTHRASHPAFSYHSIYISPYLPQKEQTECVLYKGKMFHWKDRKTMWKKKYRNIHILGTQFSYPIFLVKHLPFEQGIYFYFLFQACISSINLDDSETAFTISYLKILNIYAVCIDIYTFEF